MHVLLIHQAFTGPDEPGGTRHYELARHLIELGHRVTIVASDVSYLTGKRVLAKRKLISEQYLSGVRILRVYTFPALHRSFVWRVVSFISFMITSLIGGLRAGPVDLVIGTSPPIFQAVSAWLLAAVRRRPFVLEVRDLWPEFAIDMGVLRSSTLIRLSRWLERFLYSRAKHLLVNSPAYQAYLAAKGVPEHKVNLIPNGVDPDMFDPNDSGERMRQVFGLEGKFVVTYAGALGIANDIATILKTAERLRNQPEIHFLLVGDGKERGNLESLARKLQLTNVTSARCLPKSEIPEILAASNACIATLKDIPMFRMTLPNKVFDYMAAGRPTILAIDGAIRKVVEEANGGIFVPPGDDIALARAVRELSEDRSRAEAMGRSARNYVVQRFNRNHQAVSFAEILERVGTEPTSKRRSLYRKAGKRSLDLLFVIPTLILVLPLLLLIGFLVWLKLGAPIWFRQQRPGLNGRPFTLLKFRTMNEARDSSENLLADADRITPFGLFLRSTSLDELPELLNVLRGEMSLVGPRPLLMLYLDRYTSEQSRRHDVKPGITGWAQINGRNALGWEEKFKLDVDYVGRVSLWLDIKILFVTLIKILKREHISAEGHPTMPYFTGSQNKD